MDAQTVRIKGPAGRDNIGAAYLLAGLGGGPGRVEPESVDVYQVSFPHTLPQGGAQGRAVCVALAEPAPGMNREIPHAYSGGTEPIVGGAVYGRIVSAGGGPDLDPNTQPGEAVAELPDAYRNAAMTQAQGGYDVKNL